MVFRLDVFILANGLIMLAISLLIPDLVTNPAEGLVGELLMFPTELSFIDPRGFSMVNAFRYELFDSYST